MYTYIYDDDNQIRTQYYMSVAGEHSDLRVILIVLLLCIRLAQMSLTRNDPHTWL